MFQDIASNNYAPCYTDKKCFCFETSKGLCYSTRCSYLIILFLSILGKILTVQFRVSILSTFSFLFILGQILSIPLGFILSTSPPNPGMFDGCNPMLVGTNPALWVDPCISANADNEGINQIFL